MHLKIIILRLAKWRAIAAVADLNSAGASVSDLDSSF